MPKFRIEGVVYEAKDADDAYQQHEAAAYPGMVGGLAQSFNQGISLGGADELQAGIESAVTDGTYKDSMQRQQRQRNAFSAKHPYLSAGAAGLGAITPVAMSVIGGSLAGPPGMIAAGGASSLKASQVLKDAFIGGGKAIGSSNTALTGAREGARAAFSPATVAGVLTADPYAEGDDFADAVGPRVAGGIRGAAIGTAVGGGLGGGSVALQNASQKITPYLQKVTDFLGAERAGGSWADTPVGIGGGQMAPITSAEAQILKRLEEAGVSPEVAAMRLESARRAGVPLGLIDVGGQPTQRLGRAVRTIPGEGSNIIDEQLTSRAAGQRGRVTNFVERGVGRVSTGNAGARVDQLTQQARDDSGPLYQQVRSLPPIDDPQVTSIFETPYVRALIKEADEAAAAMGGTPRALYDEDGGLARPITFQDVNFVKRSLDEILKPAYNTGPRPVAGVAVGTQESRGLARNLRGRLIDAADNAPGGDVYASARASFAGPSQARDALESGREFLRKPTELADVQSTLREASPAERKWYQRGVVESVRGKIDSTPDLTGNRNILSGFWGSPADRAKLDAVVPTRRQGLLNARLGMENQAAQTRNYVQGGSQTADKAAEGMGLLAGTAADAATGNAGGAAMRGVETALAWFRGKVNDRVNAEIARNLTNFNDPAAQQAFLSRLRALQQQGQLRSQDVAATARAMTVTTQTD